MVAKNLQQKHQRHPGRPRVPELEQGILEIVLRQLASDGYARMSIDAVALEAGVSKPTIYRRWSSKESLAMAAVSQLRIAEPPVPSGSPVRELTGILENFSRSLTRPNGMALVGTVLAEEPHNPELLRLFRERLVVPRRRMLGEVLDRAKARGLLSPKADIEVAVTMMAGAIYGRYLASSSIPAAFAKEVAAIAWRGIARKRGA